METKSIPATSASTKIITSTESGIKTIKTIFNWNAHWSAHWDEAKRFSHSHCLVRVYTELAADRAVVIASELYSNNTNIGISQDFEGLAQAISNKFASFIRIPLSQVLWLKHYGRFSTPRSFENLDTRDQFSKMNLSWNEFVLEGEGQETVVYGEISDLTNWINLEPVEKVLIELDAASLSEWTSAFSSK